MADILGVATSLLAFTSSTLVIAGAITRGGASSQSLQEELGVIHCILTECIDTLEKHERKGGSIPSSIQQCLCLCKRKRQGAIEIMEKIYGKQGEKRKTFSSFTIALRAVAYEQPLIARFNSFRDTVTLLRDLTSE
jgi:hypothetical protein